MASLQNDAYRIFEFCGSILMSVAPSDTAGAAFKSFQVTPPSFDSQSPYVEWIGGETRRAPPRPRSTAAYRWFAFSGSMARRETETPAKKSPETWAHVTPPSVDFRIPLP